MAERLSANAGRGWRSDVTRRLDALLEQLADEEEPPKRPTLTLIRGGRDDA